MRVQQNLSPSLKAKIFRGLADPSRLAILEALRSGEKRISEIVTLTGLSQPNVSGHLTCLKDCGLLVSRNADCDRAAPWRRPAGHGGRKRSRDAACGLAADGPSSSPGSSLDGPLVLGLSERPEPRGARAGGASGSGVLCAGSSCERVAPPAERCLNKDIR